MFGRICDLFARPITGVPGAHVDVMIQEGQGNTVSEPLKLTKKTKRVLKILFFKQFYKLIFPIFSFFFPSALIWDLIIILDLDKIRDLSLMPLKFQCANLVKLCLPLVKKWETLLFTVN